MILCQLYTVNVIQKATFSTGNSSNHSNFECLILILVAYKKNYNVLVHRLKFLLVHITSQIIEALNFVFSEYFSTEAYRHLY